MYPVFHSFSRKYDNTFVLPVQLVTTFGFPYSADYKKLYRTLWSLFPPDLFAKALNILGKATATPEDKGFSWNQRGECPSFETDCVITIVCAKLCLLDFTCLLVTRFQSLIVCKIPYRMISISGSYPHFSCGLSWRYTLTTYFQM